MDNSSENLNNHYLSHLKACWEEHKHFKITKDKITFFIGTLFMTVLFGSGILIYKSIDPSESPDTQNILNRLYVIQYILMHLFFFLLYLYYTYNNVLEKIFLIEAQCCQYRLNELNSDFSKAIKSPYSLIKKYFSDGIESGYIIKGRSIKDFSNFFMVVIYMLFSAIPLLFKKDFIFTNKVDNSTEVSFKFSWLIIGSIAIILLIIVIFTSKHIIQDAKKKILLRWEIDEINKFRI